MPEPVSTVVPEIIEVSYGKTIPTRQYENVRIDLKARVHPGQDWRAVFDALKTYIAREEKRILSEIENA